MARFSIPATATLPPALTARERAHVDARFGQGARGIQPAVAWSPFALSLVATLCAVTIVASVLT